MNINKLLVNDISILDVDNYVDLVVDVFQVFPEYSEYLKYY